MLKTLIYCFAEPLAMTGACLCTVRAVMLPLWASMDKYDWLARRMSSNWMSPHTDALTSCKQGNERVEHRKSKVLQKGSVAAYDLSISFDHGCCKK